MSDKFATIYALLYGDDYKLHMRLLRSLEKHVPNDRVNINLWCNTVCNKTIDYIVEMDKFPSGFAGDIDVEFSRENVPKYKVMRRMFHELWIPKTPWIIWFDDDSYIDKPDWWKKTKAKIESTPKLRYMGQPWYVHHLPGQWEFIQTAEWYKDRSPEMCPTRSPKIKKPGITFAQGAYWWLRTDVMKEIDWPDPRLSHNGGDTLLGEAVRQQGHPFTKFHYGVAVNKAKRRGLSESPAGSKVDTRR